MKIFRASVVSLFAFVLIIVLNTKIGDTPPLAKFLDPFHGFWANAESTDTKSAIEFNIEGHRIRPISAPDGHGIRGGKYG
mgnify:CR=1 FL=1